MITQKHTLSKALIKGFQKRRLKSRLSKVNNNLAFKPVCVVLSLLYQLNLMQTTKQRRERVRLILSHK